MNEKCGIMNFRIQIAFKEQLKVLTEKAFLNVDVNKIVLFFNETILNILRNFVSQEIVRCDAQRPAGLF